jgi:hypothetical protein
MEEGLSNPVSMLTSTQIGAVGEAVVAAGLILASKGQLAPFKPFADDDGTDLLLFDKVTKQSILLQIKCRMNVDDAKSQTVQFDVRLKTFVQEGSGYILCVLLDGTLVRSAWLIPATELAAVARATPAKLVVVASAKPNANDKFRQFRHGTLTTVAQEILAGTDPAHRTSPNPPVVPLA